MTTNHLIACHECDLLLRRRRLPAHTLGRCPRCHAVLYKNPQNSLERSIALSLAGLILFALTNSFPLLSLRIQGQSQEMTLISAGLSFLEHGNGLLGIVVLLTTVAFPLADLLGMLYVLIPLQLGKKLAGMRTIFRLLNEVKPWAMLEIFMLGILVAVVKLGELATLVPGASLYAYTCLIVTLAIAGTNLEKETLWRKISS